MQDGYYDLWYNTQGRIADTRLFRSSPMLSSLRWVVTSGPRQSTGADQTKAYAGVLGSFPGPCWCEQNSRILKNLSM